ncbi:MAG: thioredoxin-dependent thiol peroxidase [Proteobacteria bacterium]|nr:thioredoxin-dependent thiol peroxidase [Pseudomonadota bacterium]
MTLLTVGTQAPDFTLPDQNGKMVNLRNSLGKWTLIYFYPKALTPGCTTQACDLRDGKAELAKRGVVVLGISPDKSDLLKKFEEKEGLNFTLLGDADHKVADAYGTWQQKSMYGKTYMGMARVTYLLDGAGAIKQVWPKVDAKNHFADVVAWLDAQK